MRQNHGIQIQLQAIFGQFGKATFGETGSLRSRVGKQEKRTPSPGHVQPAAAARKVPCDRGIVAASRGDYCCEGIIGAPVSWTYAV